MSNRSTVITRLDRVIQALSDLGSLWMPRSSRGMTRQGRLAPHRTEGSARPGGGSGAARAVGPGGCKWQVEALK